MILITTHSVSTLQPRILSSDQKRKLQTILNRLVSLKETEFSCSECLPSPSLHTSKTAVSPKYAPTQAPHRHLHNNSTPSPNASSNNNLPFQYSPSQHDRSSDCPHRLFQDNKTFSFTRRDGCSSNSSR